MKTLCIVPCGKRKIWDKIPDAGPQKAKDVYTGPYASKCIQYAQIFHPDSWCILSAKYGFLFPDEIIPGPYEVTFKKKSTSPVSSNVLSNQEQGKGLNRFDKIIALGGKVYCDLIDDLFRGKTVNKPLAGRTLGQAMKLLNEAINSKVPF